MIHAATAIRTAAVAAPGGTPTPVALGSGAGGGLDFALAIAGLADDAAPPGDAATAALSSDDDGGDDDRQPDAEGGTLLPDTAPPLDPALAWLPFMAVDPAPATPRVIKSATDTGPAVRAPGAIPGTIPGTIVAAPDGSVAGVSAPPPTIVPTPTARFQPPPDAPVATAEPVRSTIPLAVATSSLTPIPPVAPRTDTVPAAQPVMAPTPAPSGMTVQPAIDAPVAIRPVTRPIVDGTAPSDPAPSGVPIIAADPILRAGVVSALRHDPTTADASPASTATAITQDQYAPLASMVRAATVMPDAAPTAVMPRFTEPLPVPPRFQTVDTTQSSGQARSLPSTPAMPATPPTAIVDPAFAPAPIRPTPVSPTPDTGIPAPVAPTGVMPVAVTDRSLVAVVAPMPAGVTAAPLPANDRPVVTVAAPVSSAPLTAVATDHAAVPVPQPFGAATRAAACEDRPAAAASIADPIVQAPVADVRAVPAAAEAQQAPLDLTHQRWPHAMIDRIEQLRDAANATDTRIRLVPDALGPIDVSIRQEGETTHVRFTAEQAATRTLIQDAAPRLAAAAEERGLRLAQSTADMGANSGMSQPPPQQRQPQSQTATPNRVRAEKPDVDVDADDRIA